MFPALAADQLVDAIQIGFDAGIDDIGAHAPSGDLLAIPLQLDDHFADALLDVLIHATSNSSIRCIEFEGNLFSDGVLQQMKQICGGSM